MKEENLHILSVMMKSKYTDIDAMSHTQDQMT